MRVSGDELSYANRMPTYRTRASGRTEAIVRHSLLPRPFSRTFDTEEEARAYCEQLQRSLDAGVVPPGFIELLATKRGRGGVPGLVTLRDAMREYESTVSLRDHDRETLRILSRSRVHGELFADIEIRDITRASVEEYVKHLKTVDQVTPGTIKKRIGTMRRLGAWLSTVHFAATPFNAWAELPRNYSAFSDRDKKALRASGAVVPENTERDRRVLPEEEEAVRLVLTGHVRPDRERGINLEGAAELMLLFALALESAMRLREMYTLTTDQVDLPSRTIFLDKTKNGDQRQVPLTTVAVAALRAYAEPAGIRLGPATRKGTRKAGGQLLFPALFSGGWDPRSLAATTSKISGRFGRIFKYAGIEDLSFHDTRHEATCRFYERTTLSDVQIARITGHKDLRMLKRYASLRGSDLAPRLW